MVSIKLILISIFGLFFLTFVDLKQNESDKLKSGQIIFSYYSNIPKDITINGVSHFDNYGEKVITIFDKKSKTEIKKILKVDSCEFNYNSKKEFAVKSKRSVDVFFDPIIESEEYDKSWGNYKTSNKRDTIFIGMKCSAQNIVFTKNNMTGLLITWKNIKMYLNVDFGGLINRYTVTKLDTSIIDNKTDLFARPK